MNKKTICPTCGAAYDDSQAPLGLCPRCLIGAGMADGVANAPGVEAPQSLHIADGLFWGLTPPPPGRYVGARAIGQGGSKIVQMVKDESSLRNVAMAVLRGDADEDKMARFLQEARITANLEHPNIVPVHEIGVDDRHRPYFTMKLIAGETLASIIAKIAKGNKEYQSKYHLFQLLQIFSKVCDAISYAHSRGVVHLDIKPSNIQVGKFGEVLVLDWGIAKFIAAASEKSGVESPGGPPQIPFESIEAVKRRGDGVVEITLDGTLKGSPGYMAPEQVLGKSADKDQRTDIYALGATLYNILTLDAPVETGNLHDALMATAEGRIVPPLRKAPLKAIPEALDAVVMKAMSLRKEDRYQSVDDLANDINAFLGGFATKAERAGLFKRFRLWFFRHSVNFISTAAAVVMTLLFLGYAAFDHYHSWGKWMSVYRCDFTKPNADLSRVTFINAATGREAVPWKTGEGGIAMEVWEWLNIARLPIRGDVMVVAKIAFDAAPGGVFLCVSGMKADELKKLEWPKGQVFEYAAYGGGVDGIFRNESGSTTSGIADAGVSGFVPGVDRTVVFKREGERLSITVDGKTTVSMDDLLPSSAELGAPGEGDGIWFITKGYGVRLLSVEVKRLSLPSKASPLVVGDAFVGKGNYQDGVDVYLSIAEDFSGKSIGEKALAKAYLAAVNLGENSAEKRKGIRRRLETAYPRSKYLTAIYESEALSLWNAGKTEEAMVYAEEAVRLTPRSTILARLTTQKGGKPSPQVLSKLLRLVARSKSIVALDVSGMELSSLEELKGCGLRFLNCSANRIASLAPLKGMKLMYLECDNNLLPSLEGIEGMPIAFLRCDCNAITSLEPLRGMPLKDLSCGSNPIRGLEPLKGMPLTALRCFDTPVADITVLVGMPLKELALNGCAGLADLSPLSACGSLERLSIPDGAKEVEFLKQLPKLKWLDTKWLFQPGGEKASRTMRTVEQFFAEQGEALP